MAQHDRIAEWARTRHAPTGSPIRGHSRQFAVKQIRRSGFRVSSSELQIPTAESVAIRAIRGQSVRIVPAIRFAVIREDSRLNKSAVPGSGFRVPSCRFRRLHLRPFRVLRGEPSAPEWARARHAPTGIPFAVIREDSRLNKSVVPGSGFRVPSCRFRRLNPWHSEQSVVNPSGSCQQSHSRLFARIRG
jgi:hypothetical protein